jgi:hypothetical protein
MKMAKKSHRFYTDLADAKAGFRTDDFVAPDFCDMWQDHLDEYVCSAGVAYPWCLPRAGLAAAFLTVCIPQPALLYYAPLPHVAAVFQMAPFSSCRPLYSPPIITTTNHPFPARYADKNSDIHNTMVQVKMEPGDALFFHGLTYAAFSCPFSPPCHLLPPPPHHTSVEERHRPGKSKPKIHALITLASQFSPPSSQHNALGHVYVITYQSFLAK